MKLGLILCLFVTLGTLPVYGAEGTYKIRI